VSTKPTDLHDFVLDEVDIRALSDDDIAEANDFYNAMTAESNPEDPPRPRDVAIASFRNIPETVVMHAFTARTPEGRLIGFAETAWTTDEENTHLAGVELLVLAGFRRRGIGSALLARLVHAAVSNGRTTFVTGTNERVPAGAAFAAAVGASAALGEHVNQLVLADVDRTMVGRWIEEGPKRAPGYSLIAIDGAYPDDLVEQICDLHHVMNTAPRGDLDMEDWKTTVDDVRANEKQMIASGTERWFVAARHDATGQLVGFTELFYNPKTLPTVAHQGGTGVRPEHRGRALGKWLKAVNVERLMTERPDVSEIRTGNADSNDAMLGINKALGFKPYISTTAWQATADKLTEYLDAR